MKTGRGVIDIQPESFERAPIYRMLNGSSARFSRKCMDQECRCTQKRKIFSIGDFQKLDLDLNTMINSFEINTYLARKSSVK